MHWSNSMWKDNTHKFLGGDCIKLIITGQMTSQAVRALVVESQQAQWIHTFGFILSSANKQSLQVFLVSFSSSDYEDSAFLLLEGGGPYPWQKLYSGLLVICPQPICPLCTYLYWQQSSGENVTPARVGWDKQGCRSPNITSQEARDDSLDKIFDTAFQNAEILPQVRNPVSSKQYLAILQLRVVQHQQQWQRCSPVLD